MIPILFKDIIQAILKWWKQLWFESRLKARLTMIEWENQIEAELEREKQNKPIYIEHEIDPILQTGESQKLGGAMELRAPWYTDEPQPPKSDGMP
jgi:5-methylcytosine-specific restriction endonuclease McrBC GTP-binding regulatory subunit McrB